MTTSILTALPASVISGGAGDVVEEDKPDALDDVADVDFPDPDATEVDPDVPADDDVADVDWPDPDPEVPKVDPDVPGDDDVAEVDWPEEVAEAVGLVEPIVPHFTFEKTTVEVPNCDST